MEIAPSELQNIYFDFAEKAKLDYALLVKEQATLYHINNLINESFEDLNKDTDLEIYRLNLQGKRKWTLIRDTSSEAALRKIIT